MTPRELSRRTCAEATDRSGGVLAVVVIVVDPASGAFSLASNLASIDRPGLVNVLRASLERAELGEVVHAGSAADLARSDG